MYKEGEKQENKIPSDVSLAHDFIVPESRVLGLWEL